MPNPMLTPVDVARHLNVSAEQVRAWITSGRLQAINVAKVGAKKARYRISEAAVEAFSRSIAVKQPAAPKRPSRRALTQVRQFV